MEGVRVRMVEMEGKGRGLVAAQPLRGGEVVLTDSPVLLYSALLPPLCYSYCAHCFTKITTHDCCRCALCSVEVFCSPKCVSASSHSSWACESLSRLRCHTHIDHDHLLQARFLIAAYNLSPSDFQTLLSLQGSPDSSSAAAAHFLHSLGIFAAASDCHSFSLEVSVTLLAKDKLNAFGLMEPLSKSEREQGRRSVRAYGIYPKASLFNHDCLPNACRFDYPDSGSPDITVRMIHDVPEGREICLSYFPVNEKYASRQRRLREDYGFCCDCDRCKVEANWSDQEEEDDDDDDKMEEEEEEEGVDMEEEEEEEEGEGKEEESSFPHAYFFARYMCDRNFCWGTLAPLPPNKQHPCTLNNNSNNDNIVVMECNVCSNLTSVAQH